VFYQGGDANPIYGMAAPHLAISASGLLDLKTGNLLAKKEEASSTLCSSNGKAYQYYLFLEPC